MAQRKTPRAGNAHPHFSLTNIIVLVLGECTGIPLCIAGGEAFAHSQPGPAAIGWGFGIPLVVIGATFPFWKETVKARVGAWFDPYAGILIPVALLLAFTYVAGPSIYERAIKLTEKPPLPVTEKPTQPTPVITSVKIQFNASGVEPREIDSKNIKWAWIAPDEPNPRYAVRIPSLLPNIFDKSSNCPPFGSGVDTDCPKQTLKTLVLFLSFETPIHFKKIVVDPYGAKLPRWDKTYMNEKFAVLWFHGEMTNMILQIRATD